MDTPAIPVNAPGGRDADHALQRSLGVRSLAASIVNVTIGGGIFRLPAVVALGLAAAAPLAYLVCAIAFGLIVLCFAEAGSRVSLTGGPYVYVGTVFGPFAGYLSGVLIYLLGIGAQAAIASAFVGAMNALIPGAGAPLPRAIIIVGMFSLFAFINTRSVRQGARFIEFVTLAKLVPLGVFVIAGAFAITASNLAWPGMPGIGDLSRMSIVLVFAFSGVECALVPSGEVRDPSRTVPRALALAMISLTVLYIVVQVVAQGVLGVELPKNTDAPLAAAAARALGPAGGLLLIVGAIVSMFGYLSGMMLAMPRTLFAFARDGTLPSSLAVIDPVTRVPVTAIVVHAVLVTALALSGTFEKLAILSNISALLLYGLCSVAAFELRRRNIQQGGTPFRVPGGAIIPWLSVGVILFLLSAAKRDELQAVAIALGIGALFYLFRRKPLTA